MFFFRNGIYPLTAFGAKQPPPPKSRAMSPEMEVSEKSETPEPKDIEMRKIVNMMCHVKSVNKTDGDELEVSHQLLILFFALANFLANTSLLLLF